LVGKLLGVPILLYLVAGLAVPLHVWSGLAAQIPLSLILSFYGVIVTSCLFFYSGTAVWLSLLLAGRVSSLVGQWHGFNFPLERSSIYNQPHPTDWLILFLPL